MPLTLERCEKCPDRPPVRRVSVDDGQGRTRALRFLIVDVHEHPAGDVYEMEDGSLRRRPPYRLPPANAKTYRSHSFGGDHVRCRAAGAKAKTTRKCRGCGASVGVEWVEGGEGERFAMFVDLASDGSSVGRHNCYGERRERSTGGAGED